MHIHIKTRSHNTGVDWLPLYLSDFLLEVALMVRFDSMRRERDRFDMMRASVLLRTFCESRRVWVLALLNGGRMISARRSISLLLSLISMLSLLSDDDSRNDACGVQICWNTESLAGSDLDRCCFSTGGKDMMLDRPSVLLTSMAAISGFLESTVSPPPASVSRIFL